MRLLTIVAAVTLTATITGCSQPGQPGEADPEATAPAPDAAPATPGASPSGGRSVYFGDLHVHTLYSFDAFIFGTRATPDDAYRYAKGEAIRHPAGFDVQLDRPLDFYAVTDHAMFLGNLPAWAEGEGATADHPVAERIRDATSVAARTEALPACLPVIRLHRNGAQTGEAARALVKRIPSLAKRSTLGVLMRKLPMWESS